MEAAPLASWGGMGSRTRSLPSRPALNSGAVAPGRVAASSGATSAAANPASATWRRRRQRNPVPPPGRGPGGSGAAQATHHAVQRRPVLRRYPGRVRAAADQRAPPTALPERTPKVGNAHVLGDVALAQVLVEVQELLRRGGRVAVGAI